MMGRSPLAFNRVSFGLFLVLAASLALQGWAQVVPPAKPQPPITDLAFAPNADRLVGTSQAGVQVFDWPELNRRKTITPSFSNVHCLAFSPDGTRLAIGGFGINRVNLDPGQVAKPGSKNKSDLRAMRGKTNTKNQMKYRQGAYHTWLVLDSSTCSFSFSGV